MTQPPARTLQEQAYRRIREDILSGQLLPGARLKATELCKQHGVSLSVIREALTRLVEQRLVERAPQQSFAVAGASAARLKDLTMLRIHVESLALARAIERGDVAWEGRLLAAAHALSRTPARLDPAAERVTKAWAAAHAAFHATLIEPCDSPLLIELCRTLFDAAELYRRWSLNAPRQLVVEHGVIVEAVLARDTARAVGLLSQHFQRTTEAALANLTAA